MKHIWMIFAALGIGLVALVRFVSGPATVPAASMDQPSSLSADASFQPGNQAQIEQLVKNYILGHPEILIQSVSSMNERESGKALRNMRVELESGFPGAVAGNPKGDVTVVEFFDFRCPYCHTAHKEIAKLIAADPNVRVVFRDIPILDAPGQMPLSRKAAQLALAAAKQGKYKAFYDQVFNTPGRVSQESLVAAVRAIGLDERRAVRDMEADDIRKAIERNLKLAGTIGIDGTPGFVIGDELHSGAKDASELLASVQRVREKDRQAANKSSAG